MILGLEIKKKLFMYLLVNSSIVTKKLPGLNWQQIYGPEVAGSLEIHEHNLVSCTAPTLFSANKNIKLELKWIYYIQPFFYRMKCHLFIYIFPYFVWTIKIIA